MLKIQMTEEKMTPGQYLETIGYDSLGNLFDHRKKKYVCYEKDGKIFAFRGLDLRTNEIKLEDVSDLDLN